VTVSLVPRTGVPPIRLNLLQVNLLGSALAAAGAPDRDLLAPDAYVSSSVCLSWSDALFAALGDLVLVEVWDDQRAQLRPRAVLHAPVSLTRGSRRRPVQPDPWAGLPPLAERTGVMDTPLGPLLLSVAAWLGTCGGCTVSPG